MSFWTSQQLEQNLSNIIDNGKPGQVDCNAYTLRIGDEVYVSPTDQAPEPKSKSIRKLAIGEAFTIPQGQFAFLISEEIVRVPKNAMAFISIKAKVKLKGLVNVSGFHVDPGYNGRLVFSVFNAGPTVVHLKQGQDCFLIWFATLDQGAESKKHKTGFHNPNLGVDVINALPGEVQSLESLSKKIKDVEKQLTDRLSKIEPKNAELVTRVTMLVTVGVALVAFFGKSIWDQLSPALFTKPAISTPASTNNNTSAGQATTNRTPDSTVSTGSSQKGDKK